MFIFGVRERFYSTFTNVLGLFIFSAKNLTFVRSTVGYWHDAVIYLSFRDAVLCG